MIVTFHLFRPLHRELITLLDSLSAEDWLRPTMAGQWRVRDIVAHLLDTDLRRLSSLRDEHRLAPPHPLDTFEQIVRFINQANQEWITAMQRLSTRVLRDFIERSGEECAAVIETLDPHAPAPIAVAWAGETRSLMWMDIGREYTEKWHHQQQIRDAVGAPLLLAAEWTTALFQLSLRALPRAFASVDAPNGTVVSLVIEGEGGSVWSLLRERGAWQLVNEETKHADTKIRLSSDIAWRLFYNGLQRERYSEIRIQGDAQWAAPFFETRSVMV